MKKNNKETILKNKNSKVVSSEKISETGVNKENTQQSNPTETTRSKVANVYVWAFLIIVGVSILIGAIKNYSIQDNKDMLITISGILSGPLGFIIGYYFKAGKE